MIVKIASLYRTAIEPLKKLISIFTCSYQYSQDPTKTIIDLNLSSYFLYAKEVNAINIGMKISSRNGGNYHRSECITDLFAVILIFPTK